jgi:hypothetical protein
MPFYGWLGVGAGTALLAVLLLWLRFRRPAGPATVDRAGLADAERERYETVIKAEREARAAAEDVAKRLEAELRGLAADKKARLEALDADSKRTYENLVGDPDALLARLDALLGRSPQ